MDISAFLVQNSLSFLLKPRLEQKVRHVSVTFRAEETLMSSPLRERVNPLEIEIVSLKNYFPGCPGDRLPLYVQYSLLNRTVTTHRVHWEDVQEGQLKIRSTHVFLLGALQDQCSIHDTLTHSSLTLHLHDRDTLLVQDQRDEVAPLDLKGLIS